MREYPHRRDAEKAVLSLRVSINSGFRAPETVSEAIAHYTKRELTSERKSFATIDVYSSHLKLHIVPRWGNLRLTDVRTIAVEEWLSELPLAPITRAKIRNVMSAVFSHCIRHEWITLNPIAKVRTSSMRLRNLMSSPLKSSGRCFPSFHCGKGQCSCWRVRPGCVAPRCLRFAGLICVCKRCRSRSRRQSCATASET